MQCNWLSAPGLGAKAARPHDRIYAIKVKVTETICPNHGGGRGRIRKHLALFVGWIEHEAVYTGFAGPSSPVSSLTTILFMGEHGGSYLFSCHPF